jgi:hypothetical protein
MVDRRLMWLKNDVRACEIDGIYEGLNILGMGRPRVRGEIVNGVLVRLSYG